MDGAGGIAKMGVLPTPEVPLKDICSVIFNNTLYTYSADAFQSLPLTAGAEWKQLPLGEKVTGAACVGSTPGDPSKAAFFVLGGKAGKADYQGVQKYTYSTGQWETVTLPQPVTQDRLWHGAAYINSTDSILIYGGSQDGSKHPSSQTFTIGASAPYEVLAFESAAPPTINPILLPWSATEAALIGGNTWNTKIMLFSKDAKWVESGASLAEPMMKDTSAVKAMIMTGDDGSKNLYTFDMTISPNTVNRTVLFKGPGAPVQNAPPVKREVDSLTVSTWPEYNSTLAPTATRGSYALAQDPNGLVVVAGGNDEDVLCMFDARENTWRNASATLGEAQLFASDSVTSTSSLATAPTSTSLSSAVAGAATSTATGAAVPLTATGPPTNTILAAVLGSIFGLAVILFGLYLCVQRKRRQNAHAEAGHMRRSSGVSSDEKSGVGYASNSFAHGPAGRGTFRGHQTQDSQASFSSMAILMGRLNQQKPAQSPPSRNTSQNTKRSSVESTFKAFKSTISKPIPQSTPTVVASRAPPPDMLMRDEKGVSFAPDTLEPRPRSPSTTTGTDQQSGMRRSSGWNRYWSGGSAMGMLGFGGGNSNGNGSGHGASKRGTVASEASSQYSNTQHRITQDSATVPPLQIYEPRASFSRVVSRSPTIAQHDERLKEGLRGHIETQRPVSGVSSISGYSSGIPASVHEAWDPTADKPWGYDRPQNGTFYNPNPYTTPLAPASYGTRQPGTQAPRQQHQQPVTRDDMSWLNLGGN
ncbi:hypothetical protein QBC47DRAFT_158011 [Echria macrotheca]|uniref:Pre-mRNA splicing factor CLF1 n=1 Tax=Echria macrotheca TaxID=438768 RepID=A0AAJ0BFV9_9PEZI|nr:hypothetical protein QBC47DRAFT_158011 [Echria macrotheca]